MRHTFLENKSYFLFFLIVSFLILFPQILSHGFLFSGNFIFTPRMVPVEDLNAFNFLDHIFFAFTRIIPAEILQRIVVVSALTFSGFSAFLVSRRLTDNKLSIVSGLVYIVNPFVYEVLLTGDINFLLGYMMFPILLHRIIKFSKEQSEEELYKVIFLSAITIVFGSAVFGLSSIFFTATIFLTAYHKKSFGNKNVQYASIVSVMLLLLSFALNSLYPQTLVGSTENGLLSIITLQGSWARDFVFYKFFTLNFQNGVTWFLIVFTCIYFLVKKILAKNSILEFTLAGTLIVSIILILTADKLLINLGIEPYLIHTFIILCISILFPLGIIELLKVYKLENYKLILITYTLVFLASFPIFLGGTGQIKNGIYPNSYNELAKIIQKEETVLVLPWKKYEYYPFADTIISSHAAKFFDANVLSAVKEPTQCDIEARNTLFGNTYAACLNYTDSSSIAKQVLETLEVDYILINKTENYLEVSNLFPDNYYERIFEDENAVILKTL